MRKSNTKRFSSVFFLSSALLLTSCAHLLNKNQDQEKARIMLQLATDQLQERQYAKAIDSCFEALKYDPNSPDIYNHLALAYMETKRYEKAGESFNKALELKPENPDVLNNFGVLMNRQERFQEALSYFEKALAYDTYRTPENALTNMGYAQFRLGNLSRAKTLHQKALDIMPQFCLGNKNMGDIYAKEKRYKMAVSYFERAAMHCPFYPEAQYKLGLALMKVGERNTARAQLEKLVEKHKSGPYVDRSQEVLKYLH